MARRKSGTPTDTSPNIGNSDDDLQQSPTAISAVTNNNQSNVATPPTATPENKDGVFKHFDNMPVITVIGVLCGIIITLGIYSYKKDGSAASTKVDTLAAHIKKIEDKVDKLTDRIETINIRIDRLYETQPYRDTNQSNKK